MAETEPAIKARDRGTSANTTTGDRKPNLDDELRFEDPVEAIKFYIERDGLTPRDLVPIIGTRSKVSEVLSGTRALTMPMARALHRHLGIPAEALLKEPVSRTAEETEDVDWRRFPLRHMVDRGWVEPRENLRDSAEEIVKELMVKAGGPQYVTALYRKNDQNRANAKTDPYALDAWCWRVLAQANERSWPAQYRAPDEPQELMLSVAKQSPPGDGPKRAVQFLSEHGIAVEIVPHLPRTHLDGAAMKSRDGRPVIGLTLRYDRIDNFWWVLMHELAHAMFHLNEESPAFIDDLKLDGTNAYEREADDLAQDALIPPEAWEESEISQRATPMAAIALAHELGVHPSIVAGRARFVQGNYRLLSQFVGTGEVNHLCDN
jgi:HTH-type transcriptional regulator/antitoxin HigA